MEQRSGNGPGLELGDNNKFLSALQQTLLTKKEGRMIMDNKQVRMHGDLGGRGRRRRKIRQNDVDDKGGR